MAENSPALRQAGSPAVRQEGASLQAGTPQNIGAMVMAMEPGQAAAVIRHAAEVAKVFRDTIVQAGLVEILETKDGKKAHIREQGWALLSGLLGAHVELEEPEPVDYRENRGPDAHGWRVLAIVKDAAGRELAADWGMCLRNERRWKAADDYAVLGMAGTRAARRAQSRAFAWIVRLGGLEPTPAEDTGAVPEEAPPAPAAADPMVDGDPGREDEAPPAAQTAPPAPGEGAGAPPSASEGENTSEASEPATPPTGTLAKDPPSDGGEQGKVRAAQVVRMAERRGMTPEAFLATLGGLGFSWPGDPAHELGDSEELYMRALEAVSSWTAEAAA